VQAGETPSLRFRVAGGASVEFEDKVRGAQRFATDDIGDFVIRRSTGAPAFFFSNAIDDALMEVTFALRGEDHLTNTPRQVLLLRALDLPVPDYGHIALVVGPDGTPLAKRHGSRTVRELREQGFFPAAIHNYLARLGHTYSDNRFMSLDELAAGFEIAHLGRAPAHFDETQLLYWQHEAVHRASDDDVWTWMGADVHARVPERARQAFVAAVRANVWFPADARKWADIVYSDEWTSSAVAREAIRQAPAGVLGEALRLIDQHPGDFKSWSEAVKQATGAKGKLLFQPLRAALTGELDGPEMVKLLPLIGVERARKRIERAMNT
jgi:glutamyl-tRNA synthetase